MRFANAIDTDGHVREWVIPWTEKLSPKYYAMAPRYIPVSPADMGRRHMRVGDKVLGGSLLIEGVLYPKPTAITGVETAIGDKGATPRRIGEVDPHERLKDMDSEGIETAILFGSNICLGASGLRDAGLAAEVCRIYNDWLAEYCSAAPNRLKGVASVPLQDMDAAVKEARRVVKELGFVGLAFTSRVWGHELHDPYLFPIYEEAQRLGAYIAIHGGASTPGIVASHFERPGTFPTLMALEMPFEMMPAVGNLICGGVLERFPNLKFNFCESGVSWVPFWMSRLDEKYEKHHYTLAPLKHKPSEYMRSEQCFFACDTDEEMLPQVIDILGEERIVYASDYCHFDCTFPGSVVSLADRNDLSDRVKTKILRTNGLRLLG